MNVRPGAVDDFVEQLAGQIESKIRSLVAMAAKAGKLAAGYSAVRDAIEKNRVELLVYATDLSDGTREKLEHQGTGGIREIRFRTCEELGGMLSRELVGVVAFLEKGFANAVWNESERLKSLINSGR